MGFLKFLLRFFMCVFSSILYVAGAAGLLAGVWMKVNPFSLHSFLGEIGDVHLEQFLSYLLMAAGPLLVLVGTLGCCGAVKDSKCLWILFFFVALMAVVAQMAGAAVVLWFSSELFDLLGHRAVELIEENKDLILSVITGVIALEVLSMVSSLILYFTAKRRIDYY